ncbi:motile sperm domain-containing protein 2-like isoform X2 [Teleopsis dalmanni]|uniref:motile sperm domain-containing protein 2-like isoform X2 n=1 Tax=Teleopsis dalmanni TaxID=139649 RepID=UPI0018CC8C30|nr:motile sperm domain-containing protein 2-like isoform X2 [Teleopsis dalmanni]
MPIKTQTPSQAQIDELRNLFLKKLENDPPAVPFHPVDLDRVKNADLWCTRFLEMYDLDMPTAFDKLWTTCIWRQSYGANDLSEKNLRAEYLNDGVIFSRNKDIDGKPLLIFKTKLHVKGSKDMEEVNRVVVYWIERIHRETNMEKITAVFDMAGTGLGNMDLDFVKRIIDTFKQYYPNTLNYILIFEMAWVLNAAFKLIKGLLPAKALEILKMVSKKDINTYIDKNNCLTSWGGTDDYEFSFVPEKIANKPIVPTTLLTPPPTPIPTAGREANGNVPAYGIQLNQDKKVHFANSSPTRVPQMLDFRDQHTPQEHDLLRVSPTDTLAFSTTNGNESVLDLTSLTNVPITYKIQTTSPEKFRVRPRCGVLNQGESVTVNILLKPDQTLADGGLKKEKDKFLVMVHPVPSNIDQSEPMTTFWKQVPPNSPNIEEHRLTCVYKGSTDIAQYANNEKSKSNVDQIGKDIVNISDFPFHYF